jgi:hypothetical protein
LCRERLSQFTGALIPSLLLTTLIRFLFTYTWVLRMAVSHLCLSSISFFLFPALSLATMQYDVISGVRACIFVCLYSLAFPFSFCVCYLLLRVLLGVTTELSVFLTAFATSFTLLTPSGLLFVTLALSECLGLRMVVVVVIIWVVCMCERGRW